MKITKFPKVGKERMAHFAKIGETVEVKSFKQLHEEITECAWAPATFSGSRLVNLMHRPFIFSPIEPHS